MKYQLKIVPAFFLSIILISCNDISELQKDIVTVTDRISNDNQLSAENTMVITNRIGNVSLTGESHTDYYRWAIDRSVSSDSYTIGNEEISNIVLSTNMSNDTLFLNIDSPENTDKIEYRANLILGIPYNMSCVVNEVKGLVQTSYLDTILAVIKQFGEIIIEKHDGSVGIVTYGGTVSIEIILNGKDEFCTVISDAGDINLLISNESSATITARAQNGMVSISNLNIPDSTYSSGLFHDSIGSGTNIVHLTAKKGNITISGFD